jgi:hypothetical protein
MKRESSRDPAAVLRDGEAIDQAILAARRRVVLRHRQTRVPLVIWRDGKVVDEVAAESIELPPEGERDAPQAGGR